MRNSLLEKTLDRSPATSTLRDLRYQDKYRVHPSKVFLTLPFTTSSRATVAQNVLAALEMTTSGVTLPSTSSPETTQRAINELRRLSGLTWDQLAKLFNVSRRSLHFWASGQPLSRSNEERLNRLLDAIQYIDRGSANLNRSLLRKPDGNDNPLFDLLIADRYEEFKQLIGTGNAPEEPKLGALSKEEYRRRRPLSPEVLANPLPDISYHQTGRSRPARAARSRRNSSGQ